jgi:hypothetical protein
MNLPPRFRSPEHFQNFINGKEDAILPFIHGPNGITVNPDYVKSGFEMTVTIVKVPCETKL